MERDILKKVVSMRCPASSPRPTGDIPIHKGTCQRIFRGRRAVERMCKVLHVSSSSYYWRKHPIGARQQNQNQLESHIRRVHRQSQSRYGSPAPARIADELCDQGIKVSRNRVARLMQKAGIRSIVYKKNRVQTTDSKRDYPVAKNLLNRELTADKPGQKWVSDITYIATSEG